MFVRRISSSIIILVSFISLFFIAPNTSNAATCGQACGGSVACTSGTCTGGVCNCSVSCSFGPACSPTHPGYSYSYTTSCNLTCTLGCGGSWPIWPADYDCSASCGAPAYVSCASLACHTNTQNVADGNCGTHACTSNAPAYVACPGGASPACGTAASNESNGACGTHACPGNPDTTAPVVPSDTVSYTPDPSCLGTYFVSHSWGAVSDVGCAGLNTTPYWTQGSSNSGFSSVLFGWTNTWANTLSQTSASAYPPGTSLYFHVKSRDSLDNQSAWSATASVTVPTPSPYPTIHVEGPLSEDINSTCYPMSLLRDMTLEPVIVPSLGVTPVCTMPTTDSYSCNFTIDNQNGSCATPSITVTMNATYTGYGSIGWRTGTGGGECTGTPTSKTFTPGTVQADVPIYLSYNTTLPTTAPTATPLPTSTPEPTVTPGGPSITPSPTAAPTPTSIPIPTPAFAAGWFKLKDTSFLSRKSDRQNYIPGTLQLYDTTGDDSIANHNILIGGSGVLLQNGPVQAGANSYINGDIHYSANNWYTNGYTTSTVMTVSKYIDYIKSRKDFKTITSLSEITSDGIYQIQAPVSLTASQFDGKKVVLIVHDIATIPSDFIPSNGSVAILAQMIDIAPTVTEVRAVLIGTQVATGNSDTIPLKIKGNIIDEEGTGMILGRSRANGTKPSLFVVFDPQLYLNIMPYLSTSTYDWRQIQ